MDMAVVDMVTMNMAMKFTNTKDLLTANMVLKDTIIKIKCTVDQLVHDEKNLKENQL